MSEAGGRPCPQCAIALQPVKAKARSGYLLVLDQCGQCGGLWCDKWELFPIAGGEVARLDPVDRSALHRPNTSTAAPRHCPQCDIALRRFRDPVLPADVDIERCPLCEGLWLNAGELQKYDAHRRNRRPATLAPIPPDVTATISTHCRQPAQWSTVHNLSGATVDGVADDEAPENTAPLLWKGAAWLALRTLLRLLVRA